MEYFKPDTSGGAKNRKDVIDFEREYANLMHTREDLVHAIRAVGNELASIIQIDGTSISTKFHRSIGTTEAITYARVLSLHAVIEALSNTNEDRNIGDLLYEAQEVLKAHTIGGRTQIHQGQFIKRLRALEILEESWDLIMPSYGVETKGGELD